MAQRTTASPINTTGSTTPVRPTLITVLCIIGFIGVVFSILSNLFFLLFGKTIPENSFPLWLSGAGFILSILALVIWIAIWKMKKWGVWGYIALTVIGSTLGLIAGTLKPLILAYSVVITIIIIILLFTQYRKMQ